MNEAFISSTAIFGEAKKSILSKDFKFGAVANVFGQTTIDFTNADINGPVTLESVLFFGEVRIKVPANWHVMPEVTNVFVEIKDKRKSIAEIDCNKILVLKGVGIFGAIKIIDCIN